MLIFSGSMVDGHEYFWPASVGDESESEPLLLSACRLEKPLASNSPGDIVANSSVNSWTGRK